MTWEQAWAEIQRRWLPDDPVRPSEQFAGQYRLKFEASQNAKPMVIGEIGVRAGYSALAMLLGSPYARYVGFEQNQGQFGGEVGITARALPTVLKGFDAKVHYADSATLDHIDDEFDLFHVDGDHSYDGTLHDLDLAFRCSKYVLVDDYDYIKSTQAAVDHFIVTHRMVYPMCQALTDGGFRGSMLLMGALAGNFQASIRKVA